MTRKKDLRECSDDVLLCFLKQSNKDAMLVIFDRYSTEIYVYIKERIETCSPRDEAEEVAKNILQFVFASLWDNHKLLPTFITLTDYLFGVTDRMISNYLCSGKRIFKNKISS